jgi:hypothetical protein
VRVPRERTDHAALSLKAAFGVFVRNRVVKQFERNFATDSSLCRPVDSGEPAGSNFLEFSVARDYWVAHSGELT